MTEFKINWPGGGSIDGEHPIVIVGANGSGKTTLGVALESGNPKAIRIAAYRQIAPPDSLNLQGQSQVEQQLRSQRNNQRNAPWTQGNDFHPLLTKLFNESAEADFRYSQSARKKGAYVGVPPDTTASKVAELWSRIFVGRELIFGSSPSVIAYHSGTEQKYPAHQMSDGERASFYLMCAVMDAEAGLLIVDEPDTFLHPVLMRRVWDELEAARSDCRFVYITHSLELALSRRAAQFVVAKPTGKHEVLPPGDKLPAEAVSDILGALTLSVSAKALVFCESTPSGPDFPFYSAWFSHAEQAVMPVGTAAQVIESVRVMRRDELFKGGVAFGVIDRDQRSPEEIEKLKSEGIYAICMNELESIFCLPDVFRAVAKHQGREADGDDLLMQLQDRIKNHVKPIVITKLALEQVTRSARRSLGALLDGVKPNDDREVVVKQLSEALELSTLATQLAKEFADRIGTIEGALEGPLPKLLSLIHGKDILGLATEVLGINKLNYTSVVISGLENGLGNELAETLESALKPHLPPRKLGVEVPDKEVQ